MAKIRTQDLTENALRWAVANASGRLDNVIQDEARLGTSIIDIGVDEEGVVQVYVPGRGREPYEPWRPDEDWAQGGWIIEQEVITLDIHCRMTLCWSAEMPGTKYTGPTPLVAAMRCFVASHLGDEVDVPEELL